MSTIKPKEFSKYIRENQTQLVISMLQKNPLLDIITIINTKGLTILHSISLHSNSELIKAVLSYVDTQRIQSLVSRSAFTEWINKKSKDGMTALHIASYKGSLSICQMFLKYGAEHTILSDDTKLSVLHMAVQGDSPLICSFWLRKGIPIDQLDVNGSSPITWAAWTGNVTALYYLIAMGADLDHKNQSKGMTPLHYAAQSGHARVTFKLLIKGANKNIKDNDGKLPLDYAKEQNFKNIQQMLENEIGLSEKCGLRQPYMKIKANYKAAYTFVTLYITQLVLTIFYTLPFVENSYWLIIFCTTVFLSGLLYLFILKSDPGRTSTDIHNDILTLLSTNQAQAVCPDCRALKPERSKHCELCQTCIRRYDHHCPWLANCIGQGNYKAFYLFVCILLATVIFQFFMQIQHLKVKEVQRWKIFDFGENYILYGKYITFTIVICICCISIIPILQTKIIYKNLSILFWVQTCNLIQGLTTNERYKKRKPDTKLSKDAKHTTLKPIINKDTEKSPQWKKKQNGTSGSMFSICIKKQSQPQYEKPLSQETEIPDKD